MLEKRYDHKQVENGKYDFWLKHKYFSTHDLSKTPFSIVIPPPNVTGKLHLGHALDTIPADILIRYKKLKGFDTMWLPGMDHAGIATQAKVAERLRGEGIDYHSLGREGFLKKAWEWKDEYANTIHKQWAALGLSLDYSKERFTLDEKLNKCVNKVFVSLYNKGLIYQGERIINWDPDLKTALSNVEVVHKLDKGKFWYFKYPIVDSKESLIVATTRPETMFGDTAVFVNPKDKRYKKYIGKYCINPANDEKLPIMGDEYVDISFGTGAMKCTPAHDPNDFNLANKYNLKKIIVMDESAHMNSKAGKYKGLDRFACRKQLVEDIKKKGLYIKTEDIEHEVGHSERSDAVVEPYLSKQWFVKMKPLADAVIKLQKSKKKIDFFPSRFSKTMIQWMENIDDWCISRQLWWGHRIPVYYKNDGTVLVSETAPKDMSNYKQDEDVLDTWFSSALWPFSTLNWPDTNDSDYKRYFPTSLMVTGYDLIFFWVSRMVFQSIEFTKEPPFKKILIHGLIRDKQGRKMSKTLGNGIDPFDVINQYGIDALRYFLTTNSSPGLDMRYDEKKVEASQNYLNKIWNSARYVLDILGNDFKVKDLDFNKLPTMEKYIISRLNETINNVTKNMEKFELGAASSYLYNFVYDDFCSFYLEMSKLTNAKDETKQVLYHVLKSIVLMIYPYCPFISEEIYQNLPAHKESIMIEDYPTYNQKLVDKEAIEQVSLLNNMIKDIRNYKVTNKIAPNAEVNLDIVSSSSLFAGFIDYLKRFSFAKDIKVSKSAEIKGVSFTYPNATLIIDVKIDQKELKERLTKELEHINQEIKRSESLLHNENFVKKAPKEKLALEQDKYEKYKLTKKSLEDKLSKI
ncbi:MAG: valine--tRNA ligase [Bacilli bacterium]|nr:valine--tRNA ligase [Bacilli bacterium]